jgi:hypothetical protein
MIGDTAPEWGAKWPKRKSLAEAQSLKPRSPFEEWLLQLRDGKSSQRYHRCEFQQLASADGFELAATRNRDQ